MKENGAIFNHTQGWAVLAAAQLGWGNLAWEYMRNVMPASFNDKAEIRQVEPYVVCQSTHSKFSQRYGSGRVSWLSGSAVWNYVAMTTGILGIKPQYDGLEISPCIPDEWPGFKASRRFRGCIFTIEVIRGKHASLVVNDKKVEGNCIPTALFEEINLVQVTLPESLASLGNPRQTVKK
jgi:cellobiose phosphorylase